MAIQEVLRDVPPLREPLEFRAAVMALDDSTLWDTLRGQTNTTAGPDGIPFQAYLPFGMDVVRLMRDLLVEAADTGECLAALKEGTLFLIPKKGQWTTSARSLSPTRHIDT